MSIGDKDSLYLENSDSDIFYDNDQTRTSNTSSEEESGHRYKVIQLEDAAQRMDLTVSEIESVLHISRVKCKLLLIHFKWDSGRLLEQYFSKGDQSALLKEANIVPDAEWSPKDEKPIGEEVRCNICFETVKSSECAALRCSHFFCKTCWELYLTNKIIKDAIADDITCPEPMCLENIGENELRSLTSDSEIVKKYRHFSTLNYVSNCPNLRWCPSPGCELIILGEFSSAKRVKCLCGRIFCFGCGENWHYPITCANLKRWLVKLNDEDSSETQNYLKAKTKKCPKCDVPIEKDGGCNYMVCNNKKCKFKFCWVCLKSWTHKSHFDNCNSYDKNKQQDIDKSKAALEKFSFYMGRYVSHEESLRLEKRLLEKVERNINELQKQHQLPWIECQFLKEAVHVLNKCRETLMYSYAFAYFLEDGNQAEIFRSNQADLQASVEALSEYLERDLDILLMQQSLAELKQGVVDKYGYCGRRRKVLREHIREMQ